MRRTAFDALVSACGLILTATLIVAGVLLIWTSNFVGNNVQSQLASQKIYFPAMGSAKLASNPEIRQYVTPYAGEQVVNGQQAEVFADHLIAVDLQTIGGGETYSQLAAQSAAQPKNAKLAAEVQTVFQGETLRGLLLNAYAFWTAAKIAFWGAIASFICAAIMLVFSIFGFMHLRRVSPETEVFVRPRSSTSAKA
jgi:hypothetical protein